MTDPIDDTQPHPPTGANADADPAPTPTPTTSTEADAPPPTPDEGPALRADPDRPADSGWREPPWFPPGDGRRRDRDRRPGVVATVVGLVLIAIGAYYFLDRTLNIDMPRIQWGSLWPIVLIVIGILVLLRSFQRRA
jgi:hypothetical protein